MSYYENFNKFGDKIAAIQEDGQTITYHELEEYTKKIKALIPSRSLVVNFCKNAIGSMVNYLSFLNARIVPLMLDCEINEELADQLIGIYKPQFISVPEEKSERYYGYEEIFREYGYIIYKTDFDIVYPLYNELALLLTTSGSTGSPKLVRQSYTNIQSNAEAIVKYLELDDTERPITTLPMNYTYGLSIVNSHMQVGATMLLTTKTVVSKDFWTFMKDEKATSFGGVPYTYEMLKRIRFFRMDLPELRYMTQAGGKLAPELHKEFAEYAMGHGKKFIVMYGQTEATARMAYLPADKAVEKYGSMGIEIPGGSFHLVDVNGNDITEPDVVGELVYYGDNVTLGYAENGDDLANGDERNGCLETGDMAKRDSDGYYYIVGRKKRFLKLFGNRINLDEIDRMIKKEYNSIDCASSGTDELMKIYITDESLIAQVEDLIADRTHINNRAFEVVAIDKIPRNEAGKVLYKDLP